MNLQEKMLKKNNGGGIPFMEGREKGDMKGLIGKTVTIDDFGFIAGDDGDFVVFKVKEDPKRFYFGGSVLTDGLQDLSLAEAVEVRESGLPVRFTEKKSKKGRTYIATEYYPVDHVKESMDYIGEVIEKTRAAKEVKSPFDA
jgi:hypothetical protein